MQVLISYISGGTSEEFLFEGDMIKGEEVEDVKVLRHGNNILHKFMGDYYCLDKVKLAHTDYVINKDIVSG